jgi:uric acid-xanthine permease
MILPSLIAYVVTTVETIGDITATEEGSREETEGERHDRHVQGGLTVDGLWSILSCLMTSMPNTTFSQNSGIIVLTRCASRAAGIAW